VLAVRRCLLRDAVSHAHQRIELRGEIARRNEEARGELAAARRDQQVAGASLAHDPELGGWHAVVDGGCEADIDGLYTIGEACGVEAALALDLASPAAINLATRIGMGLCQGRVCASVIENGQCPPRARFPLRPCPADAFGAEEI